MEKPTVVSQYAGLDLGSMPAWSRAFLIGGIPHRTSMCLREITDCSFFVIEADEYDSAFFDKRSKFVHYRLIL